MMGCGNCRRPVLSFWAIKQTDSAKKLFQYKHSTLNSVYFLLSYSLWSRYITLRIQILFILQVTAEGCCFVLLWSHNFMLYVVSGVMPNNSSFPGETKAESFDKHWLFIWAFKSHVCFLSCMIFLKYFIMNKITQCVIL